MVLKYSKALILFLGIIALVGCKRDTQPIDSEIVRLNWKLDSITSIVRNNNVIIDSLSKRISSLSNQVNELQLKKQKVITKYDKEINDIEYIDDTLRMEYRSKYFDKFGE